MALLLAGMIACVPMADAKADAADATPVDVQIVASESLINSLGNSVSQKILVSYSDGTAKTFGIRFDTGGLSNQFLIFYNDPVYSIQYQRLTMSRGKVMDLPQFPGVVIGQAYYSTNRNDESFLSDTVYDPKISDNVVVGLRNKPQTQAATVAAVPTTGAPSSDFVLPATLLAAGMIGGGLLIRKRKDRGRA